MLRTDLSKRYLIAVLGKFMSKRLLFASVSKPVVNADLQIMIYISIYLEEEMWVQHVDRNDLLILQHKIKYQLRDIMTYV